MQMPANHPSFRAAGKAILMGRDRLFATDFNASLQTDRHCLAWLGSCAHCEPITAILAG